MFLLNATREYVQGRPKNYVADSAIGHISQTFNEWQEVDKYSRIVTLDEIRKNDYNISPSRYIQTAETEKCRPLADIAKELQDLENEAAKTSAALKSILDAAERRL